LALVRCKECGNEISTDARSCPKCGKVQRPFPVLRVVLLVILAVVIAWGVAVVRKFDEHSRAASDAMGPPGDRSPPPPPRPLSPEEHALTKAKLAGTVWSKFDQLPDSMRTLPMVQAHLLQAVQFADGVDEPWASQIRAGSEANARQRVAILLNGATDAGEAHSIFVLADDPKVCEKRKPQFEEGTANANILKTWGFKSLRCPGTGDVVFTTWDLR